MNEYTDAPVILKDFLSYHEVIAGKSPITVLEYYYDLRTFFRFLKLRTYPSLKNADFHEIDISDVDMHLIETVNLSVLYEYLSFVNKKRNNDSSTRARKVASLRSFFKYLTSKAGLLKDNPAKELDSPKLKRSMPKYLSLDEAKRLLGAVHGRDSVRDLCIITLFLNCGMRLSELANINIKDMKEDTITIIGKGNKERTIYLNSACMASIANYLRVRPSDGLCDKDRDALFVSNQHRRMSIKTIQHLVKKYLNLAGLDTTKYSTHKLRHTAATLLYRYGEVDIRILQEILGHKNMSTTEIYTHLDNQQLRQAVQKHPLSENNTKKGIES